MRVGVGMLVGLACAAWAGCLLDSAGLVESEGSGASGPSSVAATGGGGASHSSTTASGSGAEDCLDGADNDRNGLVDCADPACQPGYECVLAPPAGWELYRLSSGPYPNGAPAPCPDGSAPESYFDTPGGDASCAGCSCGPLQGASCGFGTLSCWFGGCSGGANYQATPSSSSCQNFPSFIKSGTGTRSCMFSDAAPSNLGSCPPMGGGATVPPAFATQDDACAVEGAGAGCSNGELCVPRGAAPYDGGVCIARAEDAACPSNWGTRILAYSGADDTRGCTPCSCAPSTSCAGTTVTLYDADNCGATQGLMSSPNACYNADGFLDNDQASFTMAAASPSGSCSASGGDVTGALALQGATTFCCQ